MSVRIVDGDHVHSKFNSILKNFLPYAQKKLGYDKPVDVQLVSDPNNAKDPLGKTAYYDPNLMRITVFVDKRHAKDILRSLSHELVHHKQNCEGKLANVKAGEGYAQKDPVGREMEAEAYLEGSGFLLRDWEDNLKGDEKMHNDVLQEAWKLAGKLIKENAIRETAEEEALEDVPPVGGAAAQPTSGDPSSKRDQIVQALSQNDQIGAEKAQIIMDIIDGILPGKLTEEEVAAEDEPVMSPDGDLAEQADDEPVMSPEGDLAQERMVSRLKENLGPNWARNSKDYQLFKTLRRKWCK